MDLLFAFCQELGLTSVVLVGHSDGGLLALMAAAKALESRDSIQVGPESFQSTYLFPFNLLLYCFRCNSRILRWQSYQVH